MHLEARRALAVRLVLAPVEQRQQRRQQLVVDVLVRDEAVLDERVHQLQQREDVRVDDEQRRALRGARLAVGVHAAEEADRRGDQAGLGALVRAGRAELVPFDRLNALALGEAR